MIDIKIIYGKPRYFAWGQEIPPDVAEVILRRDCPDHKPNRHGYCLQCGARIDKKPSKEL